MRISLNAGESNVPHPPLSTVIAQLPDPHRIEAELVNDCRLIVSPPESGAWNMALDEALLETAASEGSYTLRFYRWSAPTLSLGYFQHAADRVAHPASRNCPLVRRQSGGGAILHDGEWTYSFAAPAGSPLTVDAMALYRRVHQSLIAALPSIGIAARLCDNRDARPAGKEPFLCFQRRATGDVLVGDAKIAGSAQRRRRGALLQHGSLILNTSAAAPEIPGLGELVHGKIDEDHLRLAWQTGIARQLGLRLIERETTDGERELTEQLARDKYGAAEWSERR